ncbi:hypothetical protein ASPSYDRAFT_52230 [Aspergillus sydowii CBS 593.65]|uniref:Uncharacterized protein n=1 Tax=Aspergillus sydowii CBS 593.65 TaxID=1036612 RepID=A0A1L9SYJ8_9EURO|nr:uncharacterized protein ASPSYDRAFT_52230 [Aspergillus sydowii CBS 593.65]OJJ52304.1 hypothetical protein ASPSYDRAFT_52230 [Aspergillus sydowii CBS 593.65]
MNGVLADHPDHPLTRDQGERRATLPPLLTHSPHKLTSPTQVARLQGGTGHY